MYDMEHITPFPIAKNLYPTTTGEERVRSVVPTFLKRSIIIVYWQYCTMLRF